MSTSRDPIRVGIVGLGRSGWDIHASGLRSMGELYTIAAVHDPLADRLATAAADLGCRAHDSVEALLADDNVELAVIASPNGFHFPQALAALEAGKHVVCEKPFGTSVEQVDRMIAAAARSKVVLQPFQQRRYEADALKVKEICDSGVLGRLQFIRICWHGFKRRWDWQTSTARLGGELFNNGPHPIDHALSLFGDDVEPELWCERRRCLTSGDAEDHVKIIFRAPGRPTMEVELSSVVAFPQDRWLVCGTAGSLRGDGRTLEWKWVDWSTMPPRPLELNSTPDRSYNTEPLNWQTERWQSTSARDAGGGAAPAAQPVVKLYTDLHATIRHGKPQVITPASVRSRVAVLERCAAMAPVIDAGQG